MQKLQLTGKRFGRLLAIEPAGSDSRGRALWKFKCDCGTEKNIAAIAVVYNKSKTKSCGCLLKEVCVARGKRVAGKNLQRGRVIPGAPFRQLLGDYKANAKKRDLEWSLTDEQFREITQQPCFYTGRLPASVKQTESGETYIYNGVDRIESDKGYTIENCVPCCGLVNRMKMNLSQEEFIATCREIAAHFEN